MRPRRLVAGAATGAAVVVLAFATLSGAAAAEPRTAARTVVAAHSLSAPAALPVAATAAAARPGVLAAPRAVKPSPSASPKRAATGAVVPAPAPRVPNRFVIYAVYLLALVVVGLVVLWAAVGWHERPPRIDPREPA